MFVSAHIWFVMYLLQAKKSQTVETNLKNITLAKFDLDFDVSIFLSLMSHSFL